ncbi:putative SUN domain-containing protein 1 [Hypsibius exemplaris]|uniref:SUN domain-containing protein 1 n=1 Tax=Hypsibius exemplaris TaxID=2072580 RepID=A0A1W0WQI6_HYPEX|nr:putative SUN domain-containing protein 1 [Hypsibius exemplaris]
MPGKIINAAKPKNWAKANREERDGIWNYRATLSTSVRIPIPTGDEFRFSDEGPGDEVNGHGSSFQFPRLKTHEWRQIAGCLIVGVLIVVGLGFSNMGWSGALLVRRGPSGRVSVSSIHNAPSQREDPGPQLLQNLNLTFKLPEVLSTEQLRELQSSVIRFIDERVRSETSGWTLQHQDLLAKHSELNELRKTYQNIAKSVQVLAERNEVARQGRDQKIKADHDARRFETASVAAELLRIRTVHADLVQFVQNRRKSEEFLNETVRQEVLRLFEEVANPRTVMERAQAIRMWLLGTFVMPGDVLAEMSHWRRTLKTELEKIVLDGITAERAKQIALDAYEKFLADSTGLFDYALKSTGAAVISIRDTTPAEVPQVITNVFGVSQEEMLPLSPELIIQPGFMPGECWPFIGFPGGVVIKLATMTRISSFAMDYMPRKMSPTGKLLPAPKSFEVYGLESEWDDDPFQFGSYEYDADHGDHIQIFPLQQQPPDDRQFRFVELKVLSNHGSTVYTSICRFRVHGTEDGGQCSQSG